jgi:hypothetical protein
VGDEIDRVQAVALRIASSNSRATSSSLVVSVTIASALPPAPAMVCATFSILPLVRPATKT